ncbi:putative reverse transcriptase domain-containing protein [Tanacetum coccineum]
MDSSYYRRFIANFSKIAKPFASLTQKNRKYEWGREQEQAFQTLKDNLCNAPILSLPDEPEDFVVYCDASHQGLGCVTPARGKYGTECPSTLILRAFKHIIDHEGVAYASKERGWMNYLVDYKGMILEALSEASLKQENVNSERLHGIDQTDGKEED